MSTIECEAQRHGAGSARGASQLITALSQLIGNLIQNGDLPDVIKSRSLSSGVRVDAEASD